MWRGNESEGESEMRRCCSSHARRISNRVMQRARVLGRLPRYKALIEEACGIDETAAETETRTPPPTSQRRAPRHKGPGPNDGLVRLNRAKKRRIRKKTLLCKTWVVSHCPGLTWDCDSTPRQTGTGTPPAMETFVSAAPKRDDVMIGPRRHCQPCKRPGASTVCHG